MSVVVYHNLGQMVGGRVAYIRSTDVEQRSWRRLLWATPDEWLYRWARGDEVILVDATTDQRGGKIRRIYAPVLRDVVRRVVMGERNLPRESRAMVEHYRAATDEIAADTLLETKFRSWRGKVREVRFDVQVVVVDREPNQLQHLFTVDTRRGRIAA